jgi:hypothetical protein
MSASRPPTARNGSPRKRSPARPNTADGPAAEAAASLPELAGFAPANIQPIDAEMWPIQPVMWWQPEWKPGLHTSSDLRVERNHRIPIPGFLNLAAGRGFRLDDLDAAPSRRLPAAPLRPEVRLTPPESGLSLLGWDPRAVVRAGQHSPALEGTK